MKFHVSFLLFLTISASCFCVDAQATTATLAANSNPSRFGSPVILSVSVSPSSATGKVTFYDGPRVLGIASLAGGVASLTTLQLDAGFNLIGGRYNGDVNNQPVLVPPLLLTVNASPGNGFPRFTSYPAGQNPDGVASGDFNGDGKLDLAVSSGASHSVYIFLGNGNATFQAGVPYPAGSLPVALTSADMNGDGKADLIVVSAYSGPQATASIEVLLGNGNGSFQAPVAYFTPDSPFALVAGDFNLDGNVDIAVANASYSDISIFLGRGDGTLLAASEITTMASSGAVALTLGDFNGDGIADIAVGETNIAILLGNGNGTFMVGQSFPAGGSPNDVKTADFNGDGKLDLAVADYSDATVSILLGNGNGTFQPRVAYPVQNAPSSLLLSDFNGDGKRDIIVANNFGGNPGTVSVLAGAGNGTFAPAASFPAGVGPFRLAQGDFNGDGIPDLAVADLGAFGGNPGGLGILQGGCIVVSPTAPLFFDNAGGSQPFTLTAISPACPWTASSTLPGVTFSATSGTGSATVTATVPPNSSSADLTGTLTIANTPVSVFEAFTAKQFSDVLPSAFYFDAVNLLKTEAITAGCTSTMYCPDSVITRDQMAVFIVRSVYGNDNFPVNLQTPYFNDVSPTTFGYKWIQKMYELGITTGCGAGVYCPTQQVTRDQMAIFIIRARYGATTNFTSPPAPFFVDVPPTNFAFRWIQRMKEDNITSGCAPTAYCPGNPVTRGEMALFVNRGAFNLLLPPTEPIISQVTPAVLARGTTNTFTVTGVNTHFLQAAPVVVPVGGITVSGVSVLSDTQFTVNLTAPASALVQPEPVYVQSSVEAVKPNAISVQ